MVDDDDDDIDFKRISEANLSKISSSLNKIGYTDGITDGNDSMFQVGFDRGYCNGLKTAFEIAKYKAVASSLINSTNVSNELRKEIQIFEETLELQDPTNKEHFKLLQNPNKNIEEISSSQIEYALKIVYNMENSYPEINKLFKTT